MQASESGIESTVRKIEILDVCIQALREMPGDVLYLRG